MLEVVQEDLGVCNYLLYMHCTPASSSFHVMDYEFGCQYDKSKKAITDNHLKLWGLVDVNRHRLPGVT